MGEALGKAKFSGVKISIHSNAPESTSKVAANIQTMVDWGKRYGFEVNVNDAYRSWSRVYFGSGSDVKPYQLGNPRKSWEACFTKNYPQLMNGIIYKCPLTAYIKLQHAVHGTGPEWKMALDYPGLAPDCTDAETEQFFRLEEEPVCGLCPTAYHHFDKPLPLRALNSSESSI